MHHLFGILDYDLWPFALIVFLKLLQVFLLFEVSFPESTKVQLRTPIEHTDALGRGCVVSMWLTAENRPNTRDFGASVDVVPDTDVPG